MLATLASRHNIPKALQHPFYTTTIHASDKKNVHVVYTCDLVMLLQHHSAQSFGIPTNCIAHAMARAHLFVGAPQITNAMCDQNFWRWEQSGLTPQEDAIKHAMMNLANLVHSYTVRRGSHLQATPHSTYGRDDLLHRMRLGLWIVRPRTPEQDPDTFYGKPFCIQYVAYDTPKDELAIRKMRCLEKEGEGIFVLNSGADNQISEVFIGHTIYHTLCNLHLRLIDYAYFYPVDERLKSVRRYYG
jgi:hypothetical protein